MSHSKQAAKTLQNQPSLVCKLNREDVLDAIVDEDDSNDDAWRKDQARLKFVPEVRFLLYQSISI